PGPPVPPLDEEGQPLVFMPQSPPSRKCPRSATASTLPHIEDQYLGQPAPPSAYFLNLFHKMNREKEIGPVSPTARDTVVLLEIFSMIHKDYISAIDNLTG